MSKTSGSLTRAIDAASGGECDPKGFKLYLPNGGRRFLSRAAYGLGYGVTRMDKLSRRQHRAGRILARLGRPDANWLEWAPKPKWMRSPTYERLCAELARVQMEGEAVFIAMALRRFPHLLDAHELG